jgi:mono/diheme cytochrome c family protein
MENHETIMRSACIIISLVILALVSSCDSSRRIEANMQQNESKEVSNGRNIYKINCQKCHPDGEAGVGPAVANIHLPGFLTRYRIRSRSFLLWTGRMPAFKKDEISKKEMDDLIAYIKKLHHSKDKSVKKQ